MKSRKHWKSTFIPLPECRSSNLAEILSLVWNKAGSGQAKLNFPADPLAKNRAGMVRKTLKIKIQVRLRTELSDPGRKPEIKNLGFRISYRITEIRGRTEKNQRAWLILRWRRSRFAMNRITNLRGGSRELETELSRNREKALAAGMEGSRWRDS